MSENPRNVHGQESWELASETVRLALTRLGGMMAPVTFSGKTGGEVEPYYIAPWADEDLQIDVPVLGPLRGDFFCLPFGANAETGGRYTVHGETATRPWTLVERNETAAGASMVARLDVADPACTVEKRISLRPGEPLVYLQHQIVGASGAFPLGHHATLAPPAAGHYRISTSPVVFGLTAPRPSSPMVEDEYFSLPPATEFSTLASVPTIWQDPITRDLTRYPGIDGFSDILCVCVDPAIEYAWTAAVAQEAGYVWFSFRDPRVLPTTLLWVENRGRRSSPWLGRNRCIGLEDICGYLAEGLPKSTQPNPLNRHGVPTAIELRPESATTVNAIHGVLPIPSGFGAVTHAALLADRITLTGSGGQIVSTSAAGNFIRDGVIE